MLTLLISCDGYADTWQPFARAWARLGNPLPVLLVSNHLASADLPTLCLGDDRGWCVNAERLLTDFVLDDYFFFIGEDTFLYSFPREYFERAEQTVRNDPTIGALYLTPRRIAEVEPYDELFDRVLRKSQACVQLVIGIYRRQFVLDVLKSLNALAGDELSLRGGTPWIGTTLFGNPYKFELQGPNILRSLATPWQIAVARAEHFEYCHAIVRGQWHTRAIRKFQQATGMTWELGARPCDEK